MSLLYCFLNHDVQQKLKRYFRYRQTYDPPASKARIAKFLTLGGFTLVQLCAEIWPGQQELLNLRPFWIAQLSYYQSVKSYQFLCFRSMRSSRGSKMRGPMMPHRLFLSLNFFPYIIVFVRGELFIWPYPFSLPKKKSTCIQPLFMENIMVQ